MARNPRQGGRPTGKGTKSGRRIRVARALAAGDLGVASARDPAGDKVPGARAITSDGKLELARAREAAQREVLGELTAAAELGAPPIGEGRDPGNKIIDLASVGTRSLTPEGRKREFDAAARAKGETIEQLWRIINLTEASTGPTPGSLVETLDGRFVGRTLPQPGGHRVGQWEPTNISELDRIENLLTEGKTTELELIGASGVASFSVAVERRWGVPFVRRAKAADAIIDLLAIWERWGTHQQRRRCYAEVAEEAARRIATVVAPGTHARFVADEESSETRLFDMLEKHGPGAYPVWVAPWVCDLMEETLPTFPDAPLRREAVPYQSGLIRFASPLPIPAILGQDRADDAPRTEMAAAAKLRAIFWCAGKPIGYDTAQQDRTWERYVNFEIGVEELLGATKGAGVLHCALPEAEALYLIAFREQEGRVYRDEFADVPLPICFSNFGLGDEATRYRDVATEAAKVAFLHVQERTLDGGDETIVASQVRRNHVHVEGARSVYVHRYLDMLFSFMSERIAPPRDQAVEHKGQAREYRRRGLKDTVIKVVNLREIERDYVKRDKTSDTAEGRKLTDRHWVRPHYRRYHHKEGVVRHYLAPFLRGPDGTPIRDPQWTLTKVAR